MGGKVDPAEMRARIAEARKEERRWVPKGAPIFYRIIKRTLDDRGHEIKRDAQGERES